MKQYFFLAIISLSITMTCCKKTDNDYQGAEISEQNVEVVEQERDPNNPYVPFDIKKSIALTKANEIGPADYIGRSFRTNILPFDDINNLGYPVIDVVRYKLLRPYAYTVSSTPSSRADISSFYSFSNFTKNTTTKDMVSVSANANFLFFNTTAEYEYKGIFSFSQTSENNCTFGIVNVKLLYTKHDLNIMTGDYKELMNDYINSEFVRHLNSSSVTDMMNTYGGFVLSKFSLGGQASAVYCATRSYQTSQSETSIENCLNTEIGATFKVASAGTSLKFGKAENSKVSETGEFKSIKYSLRTNGGDAQYTQFTPAMEVNNGIVDMSAWCLSFKNENLRTIADLPRQALIPITAFIEEDNLKDEFTRHYENRMKYHSSVMVEPQIKITSGICFERPNSKTIKTILVTRRGEEIILRSAMVGPSHLKNYNSQELSRVKTLFPSLRITSQVPNIVSRIGGLDIVTISNQNDFDFSNMTKYIDSKTGKTYLLTQVTKNGKKIAYTLYDSSVVLNYTFRNIISGMRYNSSVNTETIRSNYYLIAL